MRVCVFGCNIEINLFRRGSCKLVASSSQFAISSIGFIEHRGHFSDQVWPFVRWRADILPMCIGRDPQRFEFVSSLSSFSLSFSGCSEAFSMLVRVCLITSTFCSWSGECFFIRCVEMLTSALRGVAVSSTHSSSETFDVRWMFSSTSPSSSCSGGFPGGDLKDPSAHENDGFPSFETSS